MWTSIKQKTEKCHMSDFQLTSYGIWPSPSPGALVLVGGYGNKKYEKKRLAYGKFKKTNKHKNTCTHTQKKTQFIITISIPHSLTGQSILLCG